MPAILFLIGDVALARNDNHSRLPGAFVREGWRVATASHEALRFAAGSLWVESEPLERFALVWLVGFGRAASFLDRMQLLRQIAPGRLVTAVDALVYRHSKYAWSTYMPESYASSDADYLHGVLERGGDWVAKPSAGSYGRDVVRVRAGASGRAALERLTGGTGGTPGQYCVLQRYVPQIEAGEKRTLVAGGRIIGSYLRLPGEDFRTNLAVGGATTVTELTADEGVLVCTLARQLAHEGVGFAAVDIAYPYLMEINLANPGGLATLEQLGRGDLSGEVARAVIAWAATRRDQ